MLMISKHNLSVTEYLTKLIVLYRFRPFPRLATPCNWTDHNSNAFGTPAGWHSIQFNSHCCWCFYCCLGSRRGSHTSLTISLSPSIGSPVMLLSESSDLQTCGRGGSLDTEPAAPSESSVGGLDLRVGPRHGSNNTNSLTPCHSACSEYQSSPTCFDTPLRPHMSRLQTTSCCPSPLTLPDASSSSLVGVESTIGVQQQQQRAPCAPLPATLATAVPLDPAASRSRPYACSHHHHHHHHSRHHRHFHHHHHCRADPCCALIGGRETDQLLNASQPITREAFAAKLRDNAAALFTEFWDIPMNLTSKKDLPLIGIGQKNRYKTILPSTLQAIFFPARGPSAVFVPPLAY